MGHRGLVPPDVGTVDVVDAWRPDEEGRGATPDRGAPKVAAVVVALLLAGAVLASSWLGAPPGPSTRQGTPIGPYGRDTTRAAASPSRFEEPIGHRVVVLTLTGLLLLDPDTGSFSELELGAIRSFGASPAVAAIGPQEVAVLFSDRTLGVVDLVERSVRRIAEDVQAVFESGDAGSVWIRRQLDVDAWELVQVDERGQDLTIPLRHDGRMPPVVVSGRPLAPASAAPMTLGAGDGRHRIEVHERRSTLRSFSVRIEDRATGSERWLRDLSHSPVLTPDAHHLLVGEPITNRLTAYDVESLASQTVQAPESAGVTLDWENLVVLPAAPVS